MARRGRSTTMTVNHTPADHFLNSQYRQSYSQGSSMLQLRAARDELTKSPWLRSKWHASTFTHETVGGEQFDGLSRNLAFHFNKHGQKFGTLRTMTEEALRFKERASEGRPLILKDGTPGIVYENESAKAYFTQDGRIVSFMIKPVK